jgi:hypothetical protein
MKNIIMIIVIAITAVAFINCNYSPTDEEIAYCNENPDNCTLGDEIVLDNGTALAKDIGGNARPISSSLAKDIGGNAKPTSAVAY